MPTHGFRNLVEACLAVISPGVMADALPAGFATPADTSKPHTWWHWMNGHVTREAITRDLEDMQRIGLGGFTLWNTHEGIPQGPVEYASEEWWRLFGHTIDEAARLGLEMGIFNCAGWSSTGAAFVTPDMAMQELAWTEAEGTGPGTARVKLPVPQAALGIERDMKRDPVINRRYYMPREHVEGWFNDLAVFAVPSISTSPVTRRRRTPADCAGTISCRIFRAATTMLLPTRRFSRNYGSQAVG